MTKMVRARRALSPRVEVQTGAETAVWLPYAESLGKIIEKREGETRRPERRLPHPPEQGNPTGNANSN
jgi:hypothetical protein